MLRRAATTDLGLKQTDIGFWCSGSSDYLAGRAFSFVSAIDAIGAVPPINESHVEMDAAWALYEAWIKILTGEVDTALVYGFGKSSRRRAAPGAGAADSTRTRSRRCGPTPCRSPACRPGSASTPGKWTAEQMAEVALRLRARRRAHRLRRSRREFSIDELLARPYFADPLRRHDIAPITDGASAIVLAAGDRARELRENPAWITGFEHRIETPVLGARDLTTSPSTAASAKAATGRRRRLDRGRRAARAVHPPGADPHRGARAGRRRRGQPVRRRARRQPDVLGRPGAHRLRGAGTSSTARRSGCWRTPPAALPAAEPGRGPGRRK